MHYLVAALILFVVLLKFSIEQSAEIALNQPVSSPNEMPTTHKDPLLDTPMPLVDSTKFKFIDEKMSNIDTVPAEQSSLLNQDTLG